MNLLKRNNQHNEISIFLSLTPVHSLKMLFSFWPFLSSPNPKSVRCKTVRNAHSIMIFLKIFDSHSWMVFRSYGGNLQFRCPCNLLQFGLVSLVLAGWKPGDCLLFFVTALSSPKTKRLKLEIMKPFSYLIPSQLLVFLYLPMVHHHLPISGWRMVNTDEESHGGA